MKKTKLTRSLLAACSIVALTAVMYGCVHDGDDPPVVTGVTLSGVQAGQTLAAGTYRPDDALATAIEGASDADLDAAAGTHATDAKITLAGLDFSCVSGPCSVTVNDNGTVTTMGTIKVEEHMVTMPPPVDPTELQKAQTAAGAGATAAGTASTNAGNSATAAENASKNAVTLQTGEMSGELAKAARKAANAAAAAAKLANDEKDKADAATDVTTAVKAQIAAVDAQTAAEGHASTAKTKGDAAVEAAKTELMIDGTMKSVGGTSVDATATAHRVTVNGQTTTTGLIKTKNPEHTVIGVTGQKFDSKQKTAYSQAVAVRTFDIGKTLDSSDDMARLMLVDSYAGTKSVKVYARAAAGKDLSGRLGSDGRIQTGGQDTLIDTDDTFVTLKSVGTYYLAGTDTADGGLSEQDVVGAEAKAAQVYSYYEKDQKPIYVVLGSTTIAGANTSVIYWPVGITAQISAAKDEDGNDIPGGGMGQVTASIPEATAYKHINFGVWAGLGDAEKDGSQSITNLGIGFVQSIGEGMTGDDMPNNGLATYNGNWAATVQARDLDGNGTVTLDDGAAKLAADFGKGEITATLTGLATLAGDISGNTFSGDKAPTSVSHSDLTNDGMFEGSFSGAFYGSKAAEAGGVFDFSSKDMKAGAFRGAFGGDRE